jgi:hypothetical protein
MKLLEYLEDEMFRKIKMSKTSDEQFVAEN